MAKKPDEKKDAKKEDAAPAPEGGGEGGSKKKLSGMKIVLFVVLPLVVLILGGAAGAYFAGLLDPLLGVEKTQDASASDKPEDPKAKRKGPGAMYDLPEMMINLNTGGRQASYIKLKVSLDLDDDLAKAKINEVLPRVLDSFQVFVRELRVEDLEGSAGVYRLKEELLLRVNAAVQPTKVYDVLFREMLVH
jgi:flagellar FliL protein